VQITVFGANGKVGRQVVTIGLRRKHKIVAFVHSYSAFSKHPSLTVVQGDVYSPTDVKKALKGSEAVISALGSWGTPKKNILSAGMCNIIPAMKDLGIKRIVSLTGADARDRGDKPGILNRLSRWLLKAVAPKILFDGEEHIRLLRKSSLDWTVLRSPLMIGVGSSQYFLRSKLIAPWRTIHRTAVAKCQLDLLEHTRYIRQSPVIRRR
jgi:putative NADH-flavin reductase